jgi:hypothetical protein
VYCTLQAPEANVPMYFATNTEDYRKRNKILRNFCSLKQEFWVRSRTARCCNFFFLFFTPGGLCGGKFICTCNVCHECIQLATLTVAVLAKRKEEVKSLQFDNSTKKNKNNVFPRNEKMQN